MKRFIFFSLAIFTTTLAIGQATSDMLERVLSSVVTVAVNKTEATRQILGYRGAADEAYEKILDLGNAESSGSGFIIEKNKKKYVITNAHVIEQASTERGSIYVYTINRSKYEARVVGGDTFYDIAVLEFIDPPGKEISTIKIRLTEPGVGETVFAIGNPLGEYPYTVSDGIISAKNRVRGGATGKFGFLQSTATVIWGNSGGPLVDSKGDLVGINSQIAFAETSSSPLWQPQINFALEAILSNRLIDDIINNNGRVKRAYIGVELSQSYTTQYDSYTLSPSWKLQDEYPVISAVLRASPAFAALSDKVGYSITKINGVDVKSLEEALGEFEKMKPDQTVTLTVSKAGTTHTVQIKTSELNSQRHEQIARHVVESENRISLNMQDNQVILSVIEQSVAANKKPGSQSSGISTKQNYVVVSVGVSEDNFRSLWRINNLSDLGAAFRLNGLYGFYDIFVISNSNPKASPEKLRVDFANSNNVKKLLLWY
ncbi:MAG: trypsin-like peptidase domain-containing protein [Bacteroidetes bacterium]|nr:trypsin-like peptidase domain-containing protein [Bacteroidota bacterium]